jgi:hypothetical protein
MSISDPPIIARIAEVTVILSQLSVSTGKSLPLAWGARLHVEQKSRGKVLSVRGEVVKLRFDATIRSIPVFEIEAEFTASILLLEEIPEYIVRAPSNAAALYAVCVPYCSELVANLSMRMGMPPLVIEHTS